VIGIVGVARAMSAMSAAAQITPFGAAREVAKATRLPSNGGYRVQSGARRKLERVTSGWWPVAPADSAPLTDGRVLAARRAQFV
jgi:uncharacterized membrane protein